MQYVREFLSDKIILLMAFIGLLFVGFNILLVILQVNTTKAVVITRYNLIQSPQFTRGDPRSLYIFALAPAVFYAISMILASRVFHKNRHLSVMILSLCFIVLLFSVIVSSAIINVNK